MQIGVGEADRLQLHLDDEDVNIIGPAFILFE
jgi:hypothetical protein